VGLEVADCWATVNSLRDQLHRSTRSIAKPNGKMMLTSVHHEDAATRRS
jgi:hypothetical protein